MLVAIWGIGTISVWSLTGSVAMEPILHKGQLKTWNDDRGFGFIKPEESGKDVFLHISAIKEASRRPQTGDTILYQRVVEPDSKLRAAKASIQGVSARTPSTSTRPQTNRTATASHRPQSPAHRPKQRGFIETILGFGGAMALEGRSLTIALLFFSIDRSPSFAELVGWVEA
jgi:cold shock CspA family protein